ncbi:hypothetical protein CLOM_g18939 [Closterium sp. NIES-68]|nr:hypothetical protein CLOM_g18939 [Closterium sp. NIES-68]
MATSAGAAPEAWLQDQLLAMRDSLPFLDADMVSGLVSYCPQASDADVAEYLSNIVGESDQSMAVVSGYLERRRQMQQGGLPAQPPQNLPRDSARNAPGKQQQQQQQDYNHNRYSHENPNIEVYVKPKFDEASGSVPAPSRRSGAEGRSGEGGNAGGAEVPGGRVFKQGAPCDCQAAIHHLVNNCLGCGKIVCEQEGEGPCKFCGVLVLKGSDREAAAAAAALGAAGEGLSEAEAKALAFRDRLVEYNRTSAQRTVVIDDQSDYFKSNGADGDGDAWLTKEEREILKRREEEREREEEERRRRVVVTLDLIGRRVLVADGYGADVAGNGADVAGSGGSKRGQEAGKEGSEKRTTGASGGGGGRGGAGGGGSTGGGSIFLMGGLGEKGEKPQEDSGFHNPTVKQEVISGINVLIKGEVGGGESGGGGSAVAGSARTRLMPSPNLPIAAPVFVKPSGNSSSNGAGGTSSGSGSSSKGSAAASAESASGQGKKGAKGKKGQSAAELEGDRRRGAYKEAMARLQHDSPLLEAMREIEEERDRDGPCGVPAELVGLADLADDEADVDGRFDICLPAHSSEQKGGRGGGGRGLLRGGLGGVGGRGLEAGIDGGRGGVLQDGLVLLKGWLSKQQQIEIVTECRRLGLGPGGFYRPKFLNGGQMKLHMMCLGQQHWEPNLRTYQPRRTYVDDAVPPPLPPSFISLATQAVSTAQTAAQAASGSSNKSMIPNMTPSVCITNFYSARRGALGMHQDKDEPPVSIRRGAPVVSFSVGDSADFLFGWQRDPEKAARVVLESGDVVVFGGASRLIFHGVPCVHGGTAPDWLIEETRLRPGRLNLTFREV